MSRKRRGGQDGREKNGTRKRREEPEKGEGERERERDRRHIDAVVGLEFFVAPRPAHPPSLLPPPRSASSSAPRPRTPFSSRTRPPFFFFLFLFSFFFFFFFFFFPSVGPRGAELRCCGSSSSSSSASKKKLDFSLATLLCYLLYGTPVTDKYNRHSSPRIVPRRSALRARAFAFFPPPPAYFLSHHHDRRRRCHHHYYHHRRRRRSYSPTMTATSTLSGDPASRARDAHGGVLVYASTRFYYSRFLEFFQWRPALFHGLSLLYAYILPSEGSTARALYTLSSSSSCLAPLPPARSAALIPPTPSPPPRPAAVASHTCAYWARIESRLASLVSPPPLSPRPYRGRFTRVPRAKDGFEGWR